ncbi:hypothetical protein BpHYR1_014760 [Brachionus plicatilis]|uniref:Uncharacterized protein n=1 Tax=Brachionus plicatilis TaxID=10195 RepID=A0A3M7SDK0_BRAPC|nr:hypothetical protein BpHYR1_014760 [Brachionus plicatilis]
MLKIFMNRYVKGFSDGSNLPDLFEERAIATSLLTRQNRSVLDCQIMWINTTVITFPNFLDWYISSVIIAKSLDSIIFNGLHGSKN